LFGDRSWTDYDFTVDLMREEGNDVAYLHFRRTDRKINSLDFEISSGERDQEGCRIASYQDGRESNLGGVEFRLVNHKWYTARVRVRRNHVDCTLHDGQNEVVHLAANDNSNLSDQVGLGTIRSSYRFKNIKVISPDDKTLWDGPPDRLVDAQGKVLWEAL
jgi:hypothetical protein